VTRSPKSYTRAGQIELRVSGLNVCVDEGEIPALGVLTDLTMTLQDGSWVGHHCSSTEVWLRPGRGRTDQTLSIAGSDLVGQALMSDSHPSKIKNLSSARRPTDASTAQDRIDRCRTFKYIIKQSWVWSCDTSCLEVGSQFGEC
jgi:hypothetical protein